MKRALLLILAVCLVALGFNTLDWLVNTFAWNPPIYPGFVWWMNTWFAVEWWTAYFFFGILPFSLGWLLIGLCLYHDMFQRERERERERVNN